MEKLTIKVGVFPYLRMKFELYAATWDQGWRQTKFSPLDAEVPQNLFDQTRESFKGNWQRWNRILSFSKAPGAIEFVKRITNLHQGWTVKDIAKHVTLMLCVLNNSLHGPVGLEALEIFNNVNKLISALKEWNVTDPALLEATKVFEEVRTGH